MDGSLPTDLLEEESRRMKDALAGLEQLQGARADRGRLTTGPIQIPGATSQFADWFADGDGLPVSPPSSAKPAPLAPPSNGAPANPVESVQDVFGQLNWE